MVISNSYVSLPQGKHLMFSLCFSPWFSLPKRLAAATTAPPPGYQVLWDAAKMGDAQAIRQVTARPAALPGTVGVGRFYSTKNG